MVPNSQISYEVYICIILQITGDPIGEVRTVSDMHQRKAEMARQADAFIALPGIYEFTRTHTQSLSICIYHLIC